MMSSTTAVALWNATASTTYAGFGASWELILLALGTLLALWMLLAIIKGFLGAVRRM